MQKYIDEAAKRYRRNLRYYPASGRNGFTERNLTVNFCAAVERESGGDVAVWYEVPTGNGKRHFDAVLIDYKNKEIFLMEAKRFTNTSGKVCAVFSDIDKITDKENVRKLREKLEDESKAFKVRGVIAADVWTKKEGVKSSPEFVEKQRLLDSFKSKTFLKDRGYHALDKLGAVEYFYGKAYETQGEDYTLLAIKIEIKV